MIREINQPTTGVCLAVSTQECHWSAAVSSDLPGGLVSPVALWISGRVEILNLQTMGHLFHPAL